MISMSMIHDTMGKLAPLCAICDSALLAWLLLSMIVGRRHEPVELKPTRVRRNYWIAIRPVASRRSETEI